MRLAIQTLGVALVLALPATAEPPKEKPPSDDELRAAVKQLGDERFAVRQKAVKLLWNAGEAAEKHLREAANGADPEVVRQARLLLDRIAYRIEPDTPADVVALMQRFRNAAGAQAEQSQIVRDMLKLGSKAHKYLLRLLDAVENKQRQLILDEFAYDDWKVLSSLVAQGQEDVVEQLLDKALAAQNETIVPHYAAFQALTNRLDGKIAEVRARAEKSNQAYDARVLLALCRLKGDVERALWAARHSQNAFWIRQVQMELGRWSELLDEQRTKPATGGQNQVTELGYLAAFQRLAGRDSDLGKTWEQIEAYIGDQKAAKNNRPVYAAKVLLVNEQPQRAMDVLTRHEQHALIAEILVSQGRYREALERSETAAKGETGAKYAERSLHVEMLLRAGEKAKAREWLAKLVADMGESSEPGWQDRLSDFQARLGDRGEVEKRLIARLERRDGSALYATFGALFPRLEGRAETLYEMLRQKTPIDPPGLILNRLRQIEEGKMPAPELAALLRSPPPVNRHTNQANFEEVARAVAVLEQPDVAQDLLNHVNWEKAPSAARLLLADALADAGRWPAAADAYRKTWELDRSAPLPMFLHAQALLRINPADAQAKAQVERSHRVPLGGDSARYHFHVALYERGFAVDAFREASFCARLLTNSSWYLGAAQDRLAKMLAVQGEAAAAAAIHQRNVLRVMPTNSGFRFASAYGRVTADIHILRAKGLLSQGKKAEALKAIEAAESLQPANLDLAIRLVPPLEKAGEKGRADKLFERLAALWRRTAEEFPDCAEAHNQLAWLSARCRRNLDEGLTHARKAVELAPTSAAYLDTLAELQFQRGDRAAAVELMKKCLKMPSANVGFYRQQMKRFQTGKPADEPAEE